MRDYSKEEREMLRIIAGIEKSNTDKFEKKLGDNFLYFNENLIVFIPSTKEVLLICKTTSKMEAINGLLEIIFFIQELSKDGYLRKYKVPLSGELPLKGIVIGSEALRVELKIDITDLEWEEKIKSKGYQVILVPELYDDLNNSLIGVAIFSPRIKELVERNFKTQEQINHEAEMTESKKQTKYSVWSFRIAIAALILSPFLTDLAQYFFKDCCQTKIDEKQIEQIIEAIPSIKTVEKNREINVPLQDF